MSKQPYSVIITGCGRSGTSLCAGMLSQNGYFMGREPINADDSNPDGYFEDREIERINEHILEKVSPKRPFLLGKWGFRNRPDRYAQRWLTTLSLHHRKFEVGTAVKQTMRSLVKESPFCFKDPRFCYTLPAWKEHLKPQTRFICMFREPGAVIASIRTALNKYPYLSTLRFTETQLWQLWDTMYQHILQLHRREGDWLFVNYDQLLQKTAKTKIEFFLNAQVDYAFVNEKLNRSRGRDSIYPKQVKTTYETLCRLADLN